ncbi:hypothetical protein DSC45_02845 [Streptomyces sp. YIM 130001]|uniref:hypothetical protein n=1 Tax=Streptomyces sp. YIM 130001 TaxID=2259644 RepID=UPI000EC162A0|nr:hypothetical protein [Streptomyces sp. YIM 130001]RII20759.1 hypothetical protein DSC45_02845 [Streptomyces sp. YIM 130001]
MSAYGLLVAGASEPDDPARLLAEVFRVPVADVDVAEADAEDDGAGRNWSASVLCEYRRLRGDVRLALDVYVQDAVPAPPGLPEAAARLARYAGATVLYAVGQVDHDAVEPDGAVTWVRVVEPDDADEPWRVTASQAPVDGLPGTPVEPLPERLRAVLLDTPATDTFRAQVDPDGTLPAGSAANRARESLMLWERLIRRMSADWPPDGTYRRDLYAEDLRARDALDAVELPGPELDLLTRQLAALDKEFNDLTIGGEAPGVASPAEYRRARRPRKPPHGFLDA